MRMKPCGLRDHPNGHHCKLPQYVVVVFTVRALSPSQAELDRDTVRISVTPVKITPRSSDPTVVEHPPSIPSELPATSGYL